jgi:hypothetical protein
MSTKPTSNAPESMQKWTRWVDKQLDELGDGAIPKIISKLSKMDANDIRYQETISKLQYQIKYLTDSITSATDFASLQNTLKGIAIATTTSPVIPPSTTETTVTFTASGSASWAGSRLITGSGTYTDAGMMYQGPAEGSQKTASFWFSDSDLNKLAGKTIISASIYVKNRHFYYNSGGWADFDTHAYQTAIRPTTTTANAFSQQFSYGEGKWISLTSTVYNGLKAKTITGFSLGIGATVNPNDYSYFDGATKSAPPKLKITYTS